MNAMATRPSLSDIRVLVRGAGEQATGIAHRLHRVGLAVALCELPEPIAVRRAVSFCEAVWDGCCTVEGVTARRVDGPEEFDAVIRRGEVPVLPAPELLCALAWRPQVLIDATIAKRNLGTRRGMAGLVIGFGPGFTAGEDVDVVVETNRGHDLGRLHFQGSAQPNTGRPESTLGYSLERVLRTPRGGVFEALAEIGQPVRAGACVARVEGQAITTQIGGVVRGLLRPGLRVTAGLKAGDVDPRGEPRLCFTISDKARALGGSALEAILLWLRGRPARPL
ncbi:MAG: EF2563 family selenium-dependent molybdenum hydroxylase system protein [Deltaproteobacteria bacterium]|nr:EF2563 family selenium-dependent molybdenum hydroxylase system protein [Deltaproteobacteria bacterium]